MENLCLAVVQMAQELGMTFAGFLKWLLFSALVWACGPGCPLASAQPLDREKLVITDTAPVSTLNPLDQMDQVSRRACEQIFEHLVNMPSLGAVQPHLAENWHRTGKDTWRFQLRKGVRFHDGRIMDARAVAYSLGLVRASRHRDVLPLEKVRKVGPYEVEVVSKCPDLPLRLAYSGYIVAPPAKGAKKGAFDPVGTGPYRFVSLGGDGVRLALNAKYWNRVKGYRAAKVLINHTANADFRKRWLTGGQTQLVINLNPHLKADLLRSVSSVRLYSLPSSRVYFMVINPNPSHPGPQALLSKPEFRRAINMAVDAERIIRVVLLGNGIPLDGVLNRQILGYYRQEPMPYKPRAARRIIRRLAPGGVTLRLAVPKGRYPLGASVAKATARYLENVGVKVKFIELGWPDFLKSLLDRNLDKWDLYYLGWGNPILEASYTLSPGFTSSTLCRVCPPYLTGILRKAQKADAPERYTYYDLAQRRLQTIAPWIFLYQGVDNYASSRDVVLKPNPSGSFRIFYDLKPALEGG